MQKQRISPHKKPSFSQQVIWIIMIWFIAAFIFSMFNTRNVQNISYSEFKNDVEDGKVKSVHVKGEAISGEFVKKVKQGSGENAPTFKYFKTVLPSFGDSTLLPLLEKKNVEIEAESEERSWFITLVITMLPWILIIGFFVYSSRQFQQRMKGGQGIFGFGKSKAKLFNRTESNVTFDDVAGLQNAKREIEEIVDFLKESVKFKKLGGKLPRGVLLAGPPGTGKTLLARAAAGEANVPFFSISGSEFIEMFVGVGASRVRDMFTKAKKDAPAIIFIDELDSIGRIRGTGVGGGHDEREQTLNQILSEMDGFSPHESVVVLAATNRPDVLDPALVRPGRFDRRITLELPDKTARAAILSIHTQKTPLGDDVDLDIIAGMSAGFSGADLDNVVNEAAIIAGRKDKDAVEAEDFDEAVDKIRMGPERENFLTDEEKRIVAYHEAGHTLVAKLTEGADPIKKVTIIPHSQSLGHTEQIPEKDRHNLSKTYVLNRIAILLGGRTSEKIALTDISSGAANDLKQATQLARRMVCQWGMSEKIGPLTFPLGEKHPFLGKEIAEPKNFSESTAQIIDEEIRSIIQESEAKAEAIISDHRPKLEALAQALLEKETLEDEDIDNLWAEENVENSGENHKRHTA